MEWNAGGLLPMSRPLFYWGGLATLWMFSAGVSAMSKPGEKSSVAYQWLYRFTHLLAANLDKAGLFQSAIPEIAQNLDTAQRVATNSFNK